MAQVTLIISDLPENKVRLRVQFDPELPLGETIVSPAQQAAFHLLQAWKDMPGETQTLEIGK